MHGSKPWMDVLCLHCLSIFLAVRNDCNFWWKKINTNHLFSKAIMDKLLSHWQTILVLFEEEVIFVLTIRPCSDAADVNKTDGAKSWRWETVIKYTEIVVRSRRRMWAVKAIFVTIELICYVHIARMCNFTWTEKANKISIQPCQERVVFKMSSVFQF